VKKGVLTELQCVIRIHKLERCFRQQKYR